MMGKLISGSLVFLFSFSGLALQAQEPVKDTAVFRMPSIRLDLSNMKRDAQGKLVIDTAAMKKTKEEYNAAYEAELSRFLVGKPCPPFVLKDMSGKVWRNTDLKGKPTLINTWHIHCGPCRREMPVLNSWIKRYPGCRFLAMTYNTSSEIASIVQETPFLFTQLVEAQEFLDANHLEAYPVDIVIDEEGIVRAVISGGETESHQKAEAVLDRLTGK